MYIFIIWFVSKNFNLSILSYLKINKFQWKKKNKKKNYGLNVFCLEGSKTVSKKFKQLVKVEKPDFLFHTVRLVSPVRSVTGALFIMTQ